jgi:hypothetical protein
MWAPLRFEVVNFYRKLNGDARTKVGLKWSREASDLTNINKLIFSAQAREPLARIPNAFMILLWKLG